MTVSRAFAFAFAALALAVLGAQFAEVLHVDRSSAEEQRRAAHRWLGQTLVSALGASPPSAGQDDAQHRLDEAHLLKEEMTLRWVWLDAQRVTPAHAPVAQPEGIPREGFSASEIEVHGERSFVSYTPTQLDHGRGAVEIVERLAAEDLHRRQMTLLLLGNTVAVLVLFSLTGWLLGARLVARPVAALAAMARQVGDGDLAARAALRTRTEFGRLAEAMNAMASSLQRQTRERDTAIAQVRHVDRLATVGQLAAGIAHELGTPLNVVQGRARMIQTGELDPTDAGRAAAEIIGETERMTALVRQLLEFAGRRGGVPVRLDVHDVVEHTLALLASTGAKRGVSFHATLAHASVTATAGQLQQVVTNLVLNAIQASPAGTVVDIDVRASPSEVELIVRDRGLGLSPEVQAHLFEPFFTTRPAGEGTGLGLAVTYGIVRDLGGRIQGNPADGAGARFEVVLPRSSEGVT